MTFSVFINKYGFISTNLIQFVFRLFIICFLFLQQFTQAKLIEKIKLIKKYT